MDTARKHSNPESILTINAIHPSILQHRSLQGMSVVCCFLQGNTFQGNLDLKIRAETLWENKYQITTHEIKQRLKMHPGVVISRWHQHENACFLYQLKGSSTPKYRLTQTLILVIFKFDQILIKCMFAVIKERLFCKIFCYFAMTNNKVWAKSNQLNHSSLFYWFYCCIPLKGQRWICVDH